MAEKYIKLEDACNLMREMCEGYDWIEVEKDYAVQKLQELPAADVKPVVRGKWIHFSRSDECPVCGYDTGKYEAPSNYCPNCGADMREVDHA